MTRLSDPSEIPGLEPTDPRSLPEPQLPFVGFHRKPTFPAPKPDSSQKPQLRKSAFRRENGSWPRNPRSPGNGQLPKFRFRRETCFHGAETGNGAEPQLPAAKHLVTDPPKRETADGRVARETGREERSG